MHTSLPDDIAHVYQQPIRSFAYKRDIVLNGKYGKMNSLNNKLQPFDLNGIQLYDELKSRNIPEISKKMSNIKNTKESLLPILKSVLKG